MKRTVIILSLIFALAIALSVSIPTLAATGTTTIIGQVQSAITISAVPASNVNLGSLTPEILAESGTLTVTVKCNSVAKTWSLKVKEDGASPDGKMSSSTDIAFNPLQVRGGDLGTTTYYGIDTERTLIGAGTATGKSGTPTSNIQFAQTASYDDDPGDYGITVLFTASIN